MTAASDDGDGGDDHTLRGLLAGVYHDRGELSNEAVVATATDPLHALHSRFEWDDSIAGHRYRLTQAGELIRRVKIRYIEEPEPRTVSAFHSIPRADGRRSYVPVEEISENPFSRELVLREMRREWQAFKRRYEHMAEFFDLFGGEQFGGTG